MGDALLNLFKAIFAYLSGDGLIFFILFIVVCIIIILRSDISDFTFGDFLWVIIPMAHFFITALIGINYGGWPAVIFFVGIPVLYVLIDSIGNSGNSQAQKEPDEPIDNHVQPRISNNSIGKTIKVYDLNDLEKFATGIITRVEVEDNNRKWLYYRVTDESDPYFNQECCLSLPLYKSPKVEIQ